APATRQREDVGRTANRRAVAVPVAPDGEVDATTVTGEEDTSPPSAAVPVARPPVAAPPPKPPAAVAPPPPPVVTPPPPLVDVDPVEPEVDDEGTVDAFAARSAGAPDAGLAEGPPPLP